MFSSCHQIQDITALANWDVSNVENMDGMFCGCYQMQNVYYNTYENKSHLRNLPKRSYPKQDHTSLLNHLWNRVKPLLKDTTKLNGYFKRYTIEARIETEPVKETIINAPNQTDISLELPSDWQSIDIPQWNP
jgi:surface protein